MQLIVAEKPSVARDIARALGVPPRGRTHFEGDGRIVTWCVGHLAELAEPGSYDTKWKFWRLDTLPIVPERFALTPSTSAPEQLRAVRGLLRDRRVHEAVNACDAGREGELIFRYVYELAGARVSTKRLWLSSMTDDAIRRAFSALEPGSRFDHLADAARCRAEADWLVGMNATRAATLVTRARGGQDRGDVQGKPRGRKGKAQGVLYSVGRVQTPTLALIVERERAIRAFVPRDYWELRGRFRAAVAGDEKGPREFTARWSAEGRARVVSEALAKTLEQRTTRHGQASDPEGPRVESVQTRAVREPPPLLFDLTSLQRTANRRFGYPAARTLAIAQALYERHKALTYPRTDARHLSSAIAKELSHTFAALAKSNDYAKWAQPLAQNPPAKPGRRVVDDGKVTDHHAIIPTAHAVDPSKLDGDERRIYDLVTRRFLGAFQPDAEFDDTTLVVRVGALRTGGERAAVPVPAAVSSEREREEGREAEAPTHNPWMALPEPPDRFYARGRIRRRAGWQEVAGIDEARAASGKGSQGDEQGDDGDNPQALPALKEGDALDGVFATEKKQTRAPTRYSEALLLGAMEHAGKLVDDKELERALRDSGLGTPATRAAVIETLLDRGYVTRASKNLLPTARGEALIDAVSSVSSGDLASAELTGRWEARLSRIARGEETRAAFMRDIESYVRSLVDGFRRAPTPPPTNGGGYAPAASSHDHEEAPRRTTKLPEKTRSVRTPSRATPAPAPSYDEPGAVEAPARVRQPAARRSTSGTARPPVGTVVEGVQCPVCSRGSVITGRAAWGCSRWREGCSMQVPFELAGKKLTEGQVRELLARGKTRVGRFVPGHGPPVRGRLVLDLEGGPRPGQPLVRFEPAA